MTIDQILNDKGREVISVGAEETLGAAAKVLDLRRIGAGRSTNCVRSIATAPRCLNTRSGY